MSMPRNTFALAQLCVRHFTQSAARRAEAVSTAKFGKLKEAQKFFGAEDEVPIYIKAGFKDKAIYGVTILATTIGLGMSVEVLYKLT